MSQLLLALKDEPFLSMRLLMGGLNRCCFTEAEPQSRCGQQQPQHGPMFMEAQE